MTLASPPSLSASAWTDKLKSGLIDLRGIKLTYDGAQGFREIDAALLEWKGDTPPTLLVDDCDEMLRHFKHVNRRSKVVEYCSESGPLAKVWLRVYDKVRGPHRCWFYDEAHRAAWVSLFG